MINSGRSDLPDGTFGKWRRRYLPFLPPVMHLVVNLTLNAIRVVFAMMKEATFSCALSLFVIELLTNYNNL